jgi:hypothetical protein
MGIEQGYDPGECRNVKVATKEIYAKPRGEDCHPVTEIMEGGETYTRYVCY